MAIFNATFFRIQNTSSRGGEHPIPVGRGALGLATLITSDLAALAQRSSQNWTAPADGYVLCFADGNVRVAAGETAAAGTAPVGVFVPENIMVPISVSAGDTLSVIDA